MEGSYTIDATIGGTAYSATSSTHGSAVLDVARGLAVGTATASSIPVSWQAVSGAKSYWVDIIDAPLRPNANRFASAQTGDTSLTVYPTTNLPSGDYVALVYAANTDELTRQVPSLKPSAFQVSLAASQTFTVP